MKQFLKNKSLSLFVIVLLLTSSAFAQIPEKPSKAEGVYEIGVDVLSDNESNQLKAKLKNYADSTSTQIVVIFIKTIDGNEINYFTAKLAEKWGVGQKGKNNGIVLLASIDDRKVAIQNGYGVEYLLTDALSKRIIEKIIKPNFKNKNYYAGVDEATTTMMQIMSGEYKNDSKNGGGSPPYFLIIVVILIILFSVFKNKGNGKNGGRRGMNGPSLMDVLILSSLGSGGGGRSSGGGFGGGGFGGGSFGGGGASGSW